MFFVFFVFLETKYENKYKKILKQYESKISKIQNTKKKIQIQNLENTKYKKIQTQNLQNTKFRKIQTQRKEKKANPMFIFGRNSHIAKKCKTNMLYFLHPAVLILYFKVVLFLYF